MDYWLLDNDSDPNNMVMIFFTDRMNGFRGIGGSCHYDLIRGRGSDGDTAKKGRDQKPQQDVRNPREFWKVHDFFPTEDKSDITTTFTGKTKKDGLRPPFV